MKKLFFLIIATLAAAQTTVTLNGNTYTLQSHPRIWLDGSSGALTTAIQDTGNRLQAGNPAYTALLNNVTNYISTAICSTGANTYSGYLCPGMGNARVNSGQENMITAANAAVLWVAEGSNVSDPNGYLALAKYAINHVEDLMNGSFACDETGNYCNRSAYDMFEPMLYAYVWQTYSIVQPQLTSGEKSTFAGKILNDNDTTHNGNNTVACTKQNLTTGAGTITASNGSNVVTGSGTSFTTALAVGDVMFAPQGSSSQTLGTVFSITSNTQVILTTNAINSATAGSSYTYATAWASGDCGAIWYMKHHAYAVAINPGQISHFTTDFPTIGGTDTAVGVGTDDQNITQIFLKTCILAGLSLADDDARAGTLLTQAYNYYYLYMYPKLKMGWDGYSQGGANYSLGTWFGVWEIAIAVQNSVLSGPVLNTGVYLSRQITYMVFEPLPGLPSSCDVWGDGAGCSNGIPIYNTREAVMACYMTSGPTGALTPDCQNLYNYLESVRGDYTAAGWTYYALYNYLFFNYNGTPTAPSHNQYVFKDHDLTYATCQSTFGSGNSPTGWPVCIQNQFWGNAISKSDWTTTATQMLIKGGWDKAGQDHTGNVQQGAFHLFRNVYLLAGDNNSQGDGDYNYCSGVTEDMIDLNCTNTTTTSYAPFSRWAGTDPTGPSNNSYAYAMVDLTSTYSGAGNATRVQRHIAHFKKTGVQDYIVEYDDIALSAAIAVAPKAYFHYFLNAVAPGTAISYSGAAKTVSNLQTTAGSKLNSAFISTAGSTTSALVVDNANGTYTGGNGNTFRAYMCPSSNGTTCDATQTAGEWIGVFEPINGTSGSMPTLTQLTSSNFRTVQIADGTTPKVAAFAQGGSTYASASFTSTHSGTGQYLVAGMSPGTYTVTVGGTPVSGSPFAVYAGDNTIYWESGSGAVQVVNATIMNTFIGIPVFGGVTVK